MQFITCTFCRQEIQSNLYINHIIQCLYTNRATTHVNLIDEPANTIRISDFEFNTLLSDMVENKNVGFSSNEINNICIVTKENLFNQEQCAICLIEFTNGILKRKLICDHIFCEQCIITWLSNHKECPICRLKL